MLIRNILLPAVLVPAGLALLWLVLLRLARRKGDERSGFRPSGAALPLVAAFVGAYVASTGWPRWLPVEATQRLFFFLVVGALLTPVLGRLSPRVRLGATFALLAPAAALLLQSPIQYRWTPVEAGLWVVGVGAVGVALAWAWARSTTPASDDDPPAQSLWVAPLRPTLLGVIALCLGLSGSALLGQLVGALAAAAAVIEVWQLLAGERVWAATDGLVWSLAVGGLVLLTFFFAELSAPAAVLIVLGLLALAATSPTRTAWRWVAPLAPVLIAAGLVVAAELGAAEADDDDYYDYGLLAPAPQEAPRRDRPA